MNAAAKEMLCQSLTERLAREKQYLMYETDPVKRDRRMRYIAALERRVNQIGKVMPQ
jgi:hypothetical protein